MKQWVSNRSKLGLFVEGIDAFLWYIPVDDAADTWIIANYLDRHPFSACYIVLQDLGYISWDTLLKNDGTIHRSDLQSFKGNILIFPWETQDEHPIDTEKGRASPLPFLEHQEDVLDTDVMGEPRRVIANYLNYLCHGARPPQLSEIGFIRFFDSYSESEMLDYVVRNGFRSVVAATARDVNRFMARFGITLSHGPLAVPTITFLVPYEVYPVEPVTKGGISRISWKDVPRWMWARQMLQEHLEIPKHIFISVKLDCEGDPRKYEDGRFKYDIQKPKPPPAPAATNKRLKSIGLSLESMIRKEAPTAPACIRNVLRKEKWYKDGERFPLFSQLISAGIEESVLQEIFARSMQFNTEPRKNTWSIEDMIKKKYVGATCDHIRDMGQGEDIMSCPFKSKGDCVAEFESFFPEKRKVDETIKFPFQYIRRYHYRK